MYSKARITSAKIISYQRFGNWATARISICVFFFFFSNVFILFFFFFVFFFFYFFKKKKTLFFFFFFFFFFCQGSYLTIIASGFDRIHSFCHILVDTIE